MALHAHLDIPKAVLSDRLAGLVQEGVLTRRPDPDRPARQVYELTSTGLELWPVLYSLLVWGGRHRAPSSRNYEHAACGTPLDDRGACPTCLMVPEPGDIVIAPKRRRSLRKDAVTVALTQPHRLLDPIDTRRRQ